MSTPPDPAGLLSRPSPVHLSHTSARWSTVNAREAFAGVVTPLTYTFYFPASERANQRVWKSLGVRPRGATELPEDPDQRFFGVFYGRMAINLDMYGMMADLTPGTSSVALEEQMFGVARGNSRYRRSVRRYPMIMLRAPGAILRAQRITTRDDAGVTRWRRERLDELSGADPAAARAIFADARHRLEGVIHRHILMTAAAQAAYERVATLARDIGSAGDELPLMASREGTIESHMVTDLGAVARGRLSLSTFIDRHGYHGTDEGHLNGIVWRQDPTLLQPLLAAYRKREDSLHGLEESRRKTQVAAAEFIARVPASRRPGARVALRLAGAAPRWRELGKSIFLRIVDVGRAASGVLGEHLAAHGHLSAPDGVYFLTSDELLAGAAIDPDVVAQRRELHAAYLTLDLPTVWTGSPVPGSARHTDPEPPPSGTEGEVRGLGVSAGIATGRVRLLHNPTSVEIDEGDVLVCHTTDPSWAAAMAISSAVVIDIGGPISHGAIVARELGIPCVINTGNGTRTLRNGDRVTVDGTAGTVTVHNP